MTRSEKAELKDLQAIIVDALACVTASPPRRGVADYLLSARELIADLLRESDGNNKAD